MKKPSLSSAQRFSFRIERKEMKKGEGEKISSSLFLCNPLFYVAFYVDRKHRYLCFWLRKLGKSLFVLPLLLFRHQKGLKFIIFKHKSIKSFRLFSSRKTNAEDERGNNFPITQAQKGGKSEIIICWMASSSPARLLHDDIVEIKAFISGVQEMAIFACVSLSHACLPLE